MVEESHSHNTSIKVYRQRKKTMLSGTFLVDSSTTCWWWTVFIHTVIFTCKYFTLIVFSTLKYKWKVYDVKALMSETEVYLKIQHSVTITVQHHIINFLYFLCAVSDIYGHFSQCIRSYKTVLINLCSMNSCWSKIIVGIWLYSSAPVSVGNMFQDRLRLCETADNTKCNT
jgi:hypothetical protein